MTQPYVAGWYVGNGSHGPVGNEARRIVHNVGQGSVKLLKDRDDLVCRRAIGPNDLQKARIEGQEDVRCADSLPSGVDLYGYREYLSNVDGHRRRRNHELRKGARGVTEAVCYPEKRTRNPPHLEACHARLPVVGGQ